MISPDEREFTVRLTTRTVTFRARVRDRGALAQLVRTRQVLRIQDVSRAASANGLGHHYTYLNLALVEEIL